ncbi:MAG: methionine adenosyltransferase [Planctomycetota bacterium]|jgi:S-adenosylmethionine synthetase
MTTLTLQQLDHSPVAQRHAEHVERKGIGHPDTICDSVMEAVSQAMCAEYLQRAGRVLHHNVDKALLVAGDSEPKPGGGKMIEPIKLIFGGRAVTEFDGQPIAAGEIAEAAAVKWLQTHLRYVDPAQHVVFQSELRRGSPELRDIFDRAAMTANDTSVGVGFAPLTETERLVLAAEQFLNSEAFHARHPECGEDVKVMAFRRDRRLGLTIALAMVDRFIADAKQYFAAKEAVREEVLAKLSPQLVDLDELSVDMNTLDDPARGDSGIYLTVLGTSADGADGGQVGRGNRVNGLISLHRPMSLEAAAGKNPVSHVGKIYNALARRVAEAVYRQVAPVQEASVWLCSQIGRPLSDPWSTSVELVLERSVALDDVSDAVRQAVEAELTRLPQLLQSLITAEPSVC